MTGTPNTTPRALTLGAYRRMTALALALVSVIIATGAAVRLTASGLGCPDWPNCDKGRLVQVSNAHQAVEQINRLFTGLTMVVLAVTVLGAFRVRPVRRDLRWLSSGLVAGVVGQGVVGGVVVLTHLHPVAVQQHYLLSIVIVTAAVVLHRRAGEPGTRYRATVPPSIVRHARAVPVLTGLVLVAGTVVTGAGPHSGSAKDDPALVRRFTVTITTIARVHSALVWVTLLVVVALAYRMRGRPWRSHLDGVVTVFLLAGAIQGTIGYVQYALGVPAGIVELHVPGSVVVWIAAVRLWLATRAPAGDVQSSLASSTTGASSVSS